MSKTKRTVEKKQKKEFLTRQWDIIHNALSDAIKKLGFSNPIEIGIAPFQDCGKMTFYQIAFWLDSTTTLSFPIGQLQKKIQDIFDYEQVRGKILYTSPYHVPHQNYWFTETLQLASISLVKPEVLLFRCYVVDSKTSYRFFLSSSSLEYDDEEWREFYEC